MQRAAQEGGGCVDRLYHVAGRRGQASSSCGKKAAVGAAGKGEEPRRRGAQVMRLDDVGQRKNGDVAGRGEGLKGQAR